MRRIIKKGYVRTYIAVCPYCGCEFTYQDEDIYDSDVNLIFCPMNGCEHQFCVKKREVSPEDLQIVESDIHE